MLASILVQPTIVAFAQDEPVQSRPKVEGHWGEDAIGFAWTEQDSVDGRWQETQLGPCLAGTYPLPGGFSKKGLAISLGGSSKTAICFDTENLHLSGIWHDGFLLFDPARYGLIRHPRPAGTVQFPLVGNQNWSSEERAWIGYEQFENEIVLNYRIDATEFHEWFRVRETEFGPVVIRSIHVSAIEHEVVHRLSSTAVGGRIEIENDVRWVIAGNDRLASAIGIYSSSDSPGSLGLADEQLTLTLPPDDAAKQVHILYWQGLPEESAPLKRWASELDDRTWNASWPSKPAVLWEEPIETAVRFGDAQNGYALDTFDLPFDNPYKALLFTSGHDFLNEDSVAICTVHGDVWIATGLSASPNDQQPRPIATWKRFATGLYQPLGLRVVDGDIFVLGRDQITKLVDRNQDGEADHYLNFNNDGDTSTGTHDYAACLETDPEGNFYFVRGNTGVERVSADGKTHEVIATGLRNPNGMGVGPAGTITVAPQEGQWTPASNIAIIQEGGHYGFRGPQVTESRPLGYDRPLCWLPRLIDNSSGGQCWVEGNAWGPLEGQLLHLSYGRCWMMLVLRERINGIDQAAVVPLPFEFDSGICRGRFSPFDGQLYVSGLRGWSSSAVNDGCFQRVRYTGDTPLLPTSIETVKNGVVLRFTDSLSAEVAQNRDNYLAERWNYRYSADYGSPELSVAHPNRMGRDEVEVRSATLLDDRRSVFVELADHRPVMQLAISYSLQTSAGTPFANTLYQTVHQIGEETMTPGPHASSAASRDALAIERRLIPGVVARLFETPDPKLESRDERRAADVLRLRLPNVPKLESDEVLGVFQNAPVAGVELSGRIRVAKAGGYQWRLQGVRTADLEIDGTPVEQIEQTEQGITFARSALRPGYVPFRVSFSEGDRFDNLQMQWASEAFPFEPIPASRLFHDPQQEDLQQFTRLRLGRELYATQGCARCHDLPMTANEGQVDNALMPELHLAAPNLSEISETIRPEWIEAWLLDPHRVNPDASMPKLFDANVIEDRQAIRDIAAWLNTLPEPASRADELRASDDVGVGHDLIRSDRLEPGERAYERLGCIACHRFEPSVVNERVPRRSLAFVDQKFRDGGLVEFLQSPHQRNASSRMPDFDLSQQEAFDLAHLIRAETKSNSVTLPYQLDTVGDPVAGRIAFEQRGCVQCHTAGEFVELSAAIVPLPVDPQSVQGCLDPLAAKSRHIPDLGLRADQRHAISAFLRHGRESLNQYAPHEASQRLRKQLNCAACHAQDGKPASLPEISLDEGWSGLPPESLPDLSFAGEKLHSQWLRKQLAGEHDAIARPWLDARMPKFPAYAETLTRGLAAEHGVAMETPIATFLSDERVAIGKALTELAQGFDCRQCHGVGQRGPTGDENTQLALGINLSEISDRLRKPYYDHWMRNPTRIDPLTKMPEYSSNGQTTKLTEYFNGDAKQQFDAIWEYIESVRRESEQE